MSEITVRHIDFQFDDDIDFHWNPGAPGWGNFVNLITMIVPAFERYLIKAVRAAIPLISDPALAHEADMFCKQEAQHSRHHIQHIRVLTNRHAGLEQIADAVMASYDSLFENEPLEFHLAYATIAELYLGPLARFMVENRRELMPDADPRIASFILWHFIEEFEHKNTALDIYNAVCGSYLYRMKCFPKIGRHLNEMRYLVLDGFEDHVPRHTDSPDLSPASIDNMLATVPVPQRVKLLYEWFCTLLPYHNPDRIREPQWIRQWHQAFQAGEDMSLYYEKPE